MVWTIFKIGMSASMITFASWLSGRRPALAGFLMALPLSSLIALALSYGEYKDAAKSVAFAKSIFLSVPLSLTFFVPFLFADRLRLPFWALYGMGVAFLAASYFVNRLVFKA